MADVLLNETEYLNKQTSLQKEIEKCNKDEEELNKQLENVLCEQTHVFAKLRGIEKMFPSLKILQEDSKSLVDSINNITESSKNVCKKIRKLDIARNRVLECQQRVSDLIDLELCSQGVQKAIQDEDYEKGAGHVHRFLSMDQNLLEQTANDVSKNASSVVQSVQTLKDATRKLQSIIKHKFDESVKNEDLASTERFFKIFPLLGMHEEGLQKFSIFLCSKLQETSQKNLQTALSTPLSDKRHSVIFADCLTLLFEGIARIIDTHQPLIETYYGPGKLFFSISILQKECDRQSKRILAEFMKFRQINKKIQVINDIQRMSNSSSFGKIERLDAKDLDALIAETAIMHARAELYIRFLKRKITTDLEIAYQSPASLTSHLTSLTSFLTSIDLTQTKHSLLSTYLRLEQYFMEESLSKAVTLDIMPSSNNSSTFTINASNFDSVALSSVDEGQLTSSMVDDIFFILKKCLRRAISTGCLDGVCAVINHASALLETGFCDVLKGKLRQGYNTGYLDLSQAYSVLQTSLQQGRLQPNDSDQSRTSFIIALNNVDISTEYVDTLCNSLLTDVTSSLGKLSENERGKLESCLSGLRAVKGVLKEVAAGGMQQMRAGLRPKVYTWIDGFNSTGYQFTEDEMASYEAGETSIQTLITNLDSLLRYFKQSLTPSNYDTLVSILTADVTTRLEKSIFKMNFNRLGGLILDKEIRSLTTYLTASTSWSIRDKFARLTQIATVLNLEKVSEIYDYWGPHGGALTWRLTPTELRQVMFLRTDFKVEEIRRLKL